MGRDLTWLLVIAILLCGGFTHTAAFLMGMWTVGFWQGFVIGIIENAKQ